jgi:hypothetical protein
MLVSSYQIHNVLNAYSKQLSQVRSTQKQAAGYKKQLSDQIQLSADGKRRATLEKVAKDILNKISGYGADGQIKNQDQFISAGHERKTIEPDNKKETTFVFNVIDDLNQKTTTALSVKDTNFLISRVEQLVREAVDNNAAT